MNKEEIKIITLGDIFRNLETEEQAFEFLKYIKNLQQENKHLKDNLNKLKEYISNEWYSYDNDSVEFEVAKDILDKMEEMIGGDK